MIKGIRVLAKIPDGAVSDEHVVVIPRNKNTIHLTSDDHPYLIVDAYVQTHPLIAFMAITAASGLLFTGGYLVGKGSGEDKPTVPVATATATTETPKPAADSVVSKDTATPTPTPKPTLTGLQCVQSMTVEDKTDMSLLVGVYPSGKSSTAANNLTAMTELSKKHPLGGLVVMANFETSAMTKYKSSLLYAQHFAIDQEGGIVQRIPYNEKGPSTNENAKIASQASVGKMSAAERKTFVTNVLTPMYRYLKEKGIDIVLGPVVDVTDPVTSKSLNDRTFSNDATLVGEIATMYVRAAKTAGINVSLKHFPGLGDAVKADGKPGNTDQGKMFVKNWNQVAEKNLRPYKTVVAQDGQVTIMVGTQTIPELTDNLPAAVSPKAIALLKQIAPNATIITDDLVTKTMLDSANGMGWTASQAAVEALGAGVNYAMLVKPDTGQSWAGQLLSVHKAAKLKAEADLTFVKTLDQTVLENIEAKGLSPCAVADALTTKRT